MRIGIIGHFGGGKICPDGQTLKTLTLYHALKHHAPEGTVLDCVDTWYARHNKLCFFKQLFFCIFRDRKMIVLLSDNGRRILFPLLYLLSRLFRREIYHFAIGGGLAIEVSKRPLFKYFVSSFNANWVESNALAHQLHELGIRNAEFVPNFRMDPFSDISHLSESSTFIPWEQKDANPDVEPIVTAETDIFTVQPEISSVSRFSPVSDFSISAPSIHIFCKKATQKPTSPCFSFSRPNFCISSLHSPLQNDALQASVLPPNTYDVSSTSVSSEPAHPVSVSFIPAPSTFDASIPAPSVPDSVSSNVSPLDPAILPHAISPSSTVSGLSTSSTALSSSIAFSALRLCMLCRIMKEKGVSDAIEAVIKVNFTAGKTIATLDLYGEIDPKYRQSLHSALVKSQGTCRYKGIVAPDLCVSVLKNYDALLFPTHFRMEGIPGTIIDAMMAGLPVIARKWQYCSEIIEDGHNGLIYDFDSPLLLSDRIAFAAAHPSLLASMKRHCLEIARNYTDIAVMPRILDAMGLTEHSCKSASRS